VNALAGGGTLITFPTLVSLAFRRWQPTSQYCCPGARYFGATPGPVERYPPTETRPCLCCLPGAGPGLPRLLLLNTGEKLFAIWCPFLILLAQACWLSRSCWPGFSAWAQNDQRHFRSWSEFPVAWPGSYGGYLARVVLIVLAVLAWCWRIT